jgi:mevalonate pyrophosphate decarboxylase
MGSCVKIPVVIRKNYVITYEYVDHEGHTFTFAHSEVYGKWTASLRRQYQDDLDQLMALRDAEPLYVLCDNEKLAKFITQLGFQPLSDVIGHPHLKTYILEK